MHPRLAINDDHSLCAVLTSAAKTNLWVNSIDGVGNMQPLAGNIPISFKNAESLCFARRGTRETLLVADKQFEGDSTNSCHCVVVEASTAGDIIRTIATGTAIEYYGVSIFGMAFSANTDMIAVTTGYGHTSHVRLFRYGTGDFLHTVNTTEHFVKRVKFSVDGSRLFLSQVTAISEYRVNAVSSKLVQTYRLCEEHQEHHHYYHAEDFLVCEDGSIVVALKHAYHGPTVIMFVNAYSGAVFSSKYIPIPLSRDETGTLLSLALGANVGYYNRGVMEIISTPWSQSVMAAWITACVLHF